MQYVVVVVGCTFNRHLLSGGGSSAAVYPIVVLCDPRSLLPALTAPGHNGRHGNLYYTLPESWDHNLQLFTTLFRRHKLQISLSFLRYLRQIFLFYQGVVYRYRNSELRRIGNHRFFAENHYRLPLPPPKIARGVKRQGMHPCHPRLLR